MLLEFSVTNFRSIASEQTFSMLPAKGSSHLHETGNPFYPDVLKVAALYGANGSGKTNLLKGLQFLQQIVATSGKFSSTDEIPIQPFRLDDDLVKAPTRMQIIFSLWGDVWRYGFSLDRTQIHSEWLYHRPAETGRERHIYSRNMQDFHLCAKLSPLKRITQQTTAPNQLLLSKLDQFSDKITHDAYIWIKACLRPILGNSEFFKSITAEHLSKNKHKDAIYDVLRAIDLKFTEIDVKEFKVDEGSPDQDKMVEDGSYIVGSYDERLFSYYRVHFNRLSKQGKAITFGFGEESLGTTALFGIVGVLIDTFRLGFVLIIDELNQSFHPEFLRLIVELARSEEVNKQGAQLIFTAHDTSVMSIMERDELWIVEKDEDGATQTYSLAEVERPAGGGTRRNGAFGKQYLENRFGGLPRMDLMAAIRALRSITDEDGDDNEQDDS